MHSSRHQRAARLSLVVGQRMLILQIALGIVLAVIILRYWRGIIAIGLFGGVLLSLIGIMVLLAAVAYNYLWYVVAALCMILLMFINDRLLEKDAKREVIKERRDAGKVQDLDKIKDTKSD
jgi:hypothetical protein